MGTAGTGYNVKPSSDLMGAFAKYRVADDPDLAPRLEASALFARLASGRVPCLAHHVIVPIGLV